MTKKFEAPKFTPRMREYIISRLAVWASYKDLWVTVTGAKFQEDTKIETLNPELYTFDLFRMRCSRMPKHEIALAHEAYQLEIGAAKWAEDKIRLQGMSDLIDKVTVIVDKATYNKDTTGTLAALIGSLRGLYEQMRKEQQADLDREALSASGTRILLTNPKNVKLDIDYVSEMLLIYREEIGGLHNLDFDALNITELSLLHDKIEDAIANKVEVIEEAEEVEDEDETTD